ncbi:hypothetical protein GEV33_013919 [Tenebrio molitor]|uniref:Uncharacterized protein n=1 Tax=Tenebrio molitor TaxID=7067 RepID=A0A8J6H6P7_TENMO|nr:hypothetical protein GEV33_013919 [Tenebrio molitor]
MDLVFRPSLSFLAEAHPRLENKQGQIILFFGYLVVLTGSRNPTSGTGRDEFARVGAKGIKDGTDAILEVHGSRQGHDRYSVLQQVLANPWRKTETAGRIVQRELQPYAAADLGFIHEGQPLYASTDHISPPCWPAVIPQDPTREQDLTPDSPRLRIPKSRNRNYLARSFSVILSSSGILANFFYIVYVIGLEEGSKGGRTPRTFREYGRRSGLAAKEGLGGPFFSSLFPGLIWIDFHTLDPV